MDRVVVNGRFVLEDPTGVQRFAEQTLLALARMRTDVLLVAPRGPLPSSLEKVRVQQIGRHRGTLWEQFELPRYLRACDAPLLLNLANRAPMLYRPKIMTLHDVMVQRGIGSFSRRFRATNGAMTRAALARGTLAVVTVSEFSKREIETQYPRGGYAITVVPNAVNPSWFHRDDGAGADEGAYVLAFGRSGTNRNTRVVVDAAAALARSGQPVRVKWVGTIDPELAATLAAETAPHELIGRVSDDELHALYAGSSAFIAPSRYEGFDLPPLEAQAAGTLVLASDIPVHREVLRDGAFYFDPGSPDALAEAIRRVLHGTGAAREAALAAAEANARRYSWDRSASLLDAVIEDALR